MLLVEWQAWWAAIPGIEAERLLGQYQIMLASDPGWKLDRDRIIDRLHQLAADANPIVVIEESLAKYDPSDPWGLRRQVRRVAAWLKKEYGGGGTIDSG